MSAIRFSIVAAMNRLHGIGFKGGLPWRLSGDMKFFKNITTKTIDASKRNAVIMGRKTYLSFPDKYKPLADRINIIISRDTELKSKLQLPESVYVCRSIDEALILTQNQNINPMIESVFVIGGGQIYKQAIALPECAKLYLTEVDDDTACDTFFPEIPSSFQKTKESDLMTDKNTSYRFTEYERQFEPMIPPCHTNLTNHEERQYLDLIGYIMNHGVLRTDRTNTGTRSVFGAQMRFSLDNGVIPLITTKRIFWRGVVEELLWFIHGCTDGGVLKEKNIHFWEDNGTREFLDNRGLTNYAVDDLGPVYGFQWRHFGAEYNNCKTDYTDKGVDQLKEVIHLLKTDPYNRRIILSAWNPADISKMALPPCHIFSQFYVQNGRLSCLMYQRSADMGLGVPFNIASYSALTILLAHITGYKPGEYIHVLGDAHVYITHEEALQEQLNREPKEFPTLNITKLSDNIDDYTFEDFDLKNYNPYSNLKMKMAI